MRVPVRSVRLAVAVVWCGSVGSRAAHARPDDGTGLFTFEPTDVLAHHDVPGADIRVHYAVDGPSVTLLEDLDADGVPDFVATVGQEVATVLGVFQARGFRAPVQESEVGLDPLGGSDALDVYLVDFGGSSDGQFSVDRCRSGVCAGHLLIENDFSGYGYSSPAAAAEVLASHELFHGVQYAYTDDLDPWFSEGTATWAEHLYLPELQDYIRLCRAYLTDVGRSIDRPPAGTVTSWSYGTALFFGFVQEVAGAEVMVDMFEALAAAGDGDEVAAIDTALGGAGTSLGAVWHTFATWNLATGPRRGGIDTYPYAAALGPGVEPEATGSSIVDDHRFYPLAATYFLLEHDGGELLLGVGEDNDETVVFSVHPSADGTSEGTVQPALGTWSPGARSIESLGDQPEGAYWLIGSYPQVAPESEKRVFCFGGEDAMEACTADAETGDDTGTLDSADPSTGGDPEAAGAGTSGGDDKGGCAVAAGSGSLSGVLLGLVALARRRT